MKVLVLDLCGGLSISLSLPLSLNYHLYVLCGGGPLENSDNITLLALAAGQELTWLYPAITLTVGLGRAQGVSSSCTQAATCLTSSSHTQAG